MPKQWAAEKKFTIKCPVCGQLGLPTIGNNGRGYRVIHPGRIVSCFVREGSNVAESIRTRLDEWFGTNDATIAPQARTGRISHPDDSIYAEWSETYVGHVPNDRAQNLWRRFYGEVPLEVEHWENEGGACTFASE
jgi:hypothetical protein